VEHLVEARRGLCSRLGIGSASSSKRAQATTSWISACDATSAWKPRVGGSGSAKRAQSRTGWRVKCPLSSRPSVWTPALGKCRRRPRAAAPPTTTAADGGSRSARARLRRLRKSSSEALPHAFARIIPDVNICTVRYRRGPLHVRNAN
jgi:hypothetical protein